ncbi:unnamed protein product [Closterium sp. Naga37s-1]|nr:unnamed protein product [Closterium sp. Naga37s-1]
MGPPRVPPLTAHVPHARHGRTIDGRNGRDRRSGHGGELVAPPPSQPVRLTLPQPVPSPSSGAQCAQPHARSRKRAAARTSPATRATAAKCTAPAVGAAAAARTTAASCVAADTRATEAACYAAPPHLTPFSLLLVHQRGGGGEGRGRFVGGTTLVAVVAALSLPPVPFSSPPSPFLPAPTSAVRGGGVMQHQPPTSSSSLSLPPVVVLGGGGMGLEVKAVVGGDL